MRLRATVTSGSTLLVFAFLSATLPLHAQGVDVYEATITQLQDALAQGRTTSVQLVEAYLARIAAYDQQGPALNSLILINPRAREDAAAMDRERRERGPRGPLHGIPVILKDNFSTRDLPTTAGSVAFIGMQPKDDAFVVRKLRDSGAIILGKANMDELAAGTAGLSSLGGQTRNPYDPRRVPGGSSAGTGAAIAASFAAVGWGSDTTGSIRIPSSFGSLVGLRPTQGLVSKQGILPLSRTQDLGGPMARTVTDLAIAMDATIGRDPDDPATAALEGRVLPRFVESLRRDALRGARLGILTHYFADTQSDIERVARAAIEAMKAQGAEVVEVSIPGFDGLLARSRTVDFETRFDLMDYLRGVPNAPLQSMAEMHERGLYHERLESRFTRAAAVTVRDNEGLREALSRQAMVREVVSGFFDILTLDALVYPTMRRKPAFIGDDGQENGSTAVLSSHTGFPSLTVPAGFTPDGLPVGIELLGRAFSDARLVAMAFAWEQTGPHRRPPGTTPPLMNGRAPQPKTFTATIAGAPFAGGATFSFDPLQSRLDFDVRLTGVRADSVRALLLRRSDGKSGAGPVIQRLGPPGVASARGSVQLDGAKRELLMTGHLSLMVVAGDQSMSTANAPLVPAGR